MGSKPKKQAMAFHANSIRELAERINENGIEKEDIVQVISTENGFFLLYYVGKDSK